MLEESYVWILEVSEIRDTILYHDETIESESKGKSRVYARIQSSLAYHMRVYESCTHELYPARSFTYLTSCSIAKWTREIHLHTWLYEWEIPRSHAYLDIFLEEVSEHRRDSEFEVSYIDILIYHDTLYLVKCIIMCRIDIFISKYASRDDSSYRSLGRAEDEILHARCLCREHVRFSLEPKCILHITCGMIFRDIYSIEVQIFGRHLHRLIYIESHTSECILDFLADSRNRVDTTVFIFIGDSRIFPFFGQF